MFGYVISSFSALGDSIAQAKVVPFMIETVDEKEHK